MIQSVCLMESSIGDDVLLAKLVWMDTQACMTAYVSALHIYFF